MLVRSIENWTTILKSWHSSQESDSSTNCWMYSYIIHVVHSAFSTDFFDNNARVYIMFIHSMQSDLYKPEHHLQGWTLIHNPYLMVLDVLSAGVWESRRLPVCIGLPLRLREPAHLCTPAVVEVVGLLHGVGEGVPPLWGQGLQGGPPGWGGRRESYKDEGDKTWQNCYNEPTQSALMIHLGIHAYCRRYTYWIQMLGLKYTVNKPYS